MTEQRRSQTGLNRRHFIGGSVLGAIGGLLGLRAKPAPARHAAPIHLDADDLSKFRYVRCVAIPSQGCEEPFTMRLVVQGAYDASGEWREIDPADYGVVFPPNRDLQT